MRTNRPGHTPTHRGPATSPGPECPETQHPGANDEALTELSRNLLMTLNRTIEGEIVPRLMMAFDTGPQEEPDVPETDNMPTSGDLEEFVHLLLNHDAAIAIRYVGELRSRGTPLAAIYLDLLAPAARRLGRLWEDDYCSFTDVTVGVSRMHQVLLEFGRCFDGFEESSTSGRNALIVPAPGEQHTFGLFMVIEFFRRAGWHCWSGTPNNLSEIFDRVRQQEFDVVGLSIGAERNLDTVANEIAEIRNRSKKPDTLILVGGKIFVDQPKLAEQIGADGTGADGREAVRAVEHLRSQGIGHAR